MHGLEPPWLLATKPTKSKTWLKIYCTSLSWKHVFELCIWTSMIIIWRMWVDFTLISTSSFSCHEFPNWWTQTNTYRKSNQIKYNVEKTLNTIYCYMLFNLIHNHITCNIKEPVCDCDIMVCEPTYNLDYLVCVQNVNPHPNVLLLPTNFLGTLSLWETLHLPP
jgi:hypothetical protein